MGCNNHDDTGGEFIFAASGWSIDGSGSVSHCMRKVHTACALHDPEVSMSRQPRMAFQIPEETQRVTRGLSPEHALSTNCRCAGAGL